MNSGSAVRESFSRDDRLRKRREFEECYASGVRVSGRFLQIFVRVRSGGAGPIRLGLSVPRRAGNAVARNRLRRRLREIFRRSRASFRGSGFDLVVQSRPGASAAIFSDLRGDFLGLVERALSRSRVG
ncbi:MAG TPA: ribonuclease P protein component [Thermoanaerobaculia bacterium]|nr:ribonuclease P protein component [Thermoanaerobaculia bacterium]